jgi:hypothetical protein
MKNTTRENIEALRKFYAPQDSEVIRAADSSAVAYLAPIPNRAPKFSATGFSGRRTKPDFNYIFKDEPAARAYIAQHAASVKRTEDYRLERAAARKAARCNGPEQVWSKARASHSITAAEAAICLRAVLARKFPGVKFSVRSDGSLNVRWTDGPSYREVNAIARAYSFEGFDGMVDCRYQIRRWLARDGSISLAHSPGHAGGGGTEAVGDPHHASAVLVNHGPDFVFCTRERSPAAELELARRVAEKWGVEMPAFESDLDFQRWKNSTVVPRADEWLATLMHRAENED